MAQRKLNIKLLMKLRNRFRRMKHKLHFDMKNWVTRNECGTAMCKIAEKVDDTADRLQRHGEDVVCLDRRLTEIEALLHLPNSKPDHVCSQCGHITTFGVDPDRSVAEKRREAAERVQKVLAAASSRDVSPQDIDAVIDRLAEIDRFHTPYRDDDNKEWCSGCNNTQWPCPTIEILNDQRRAKWWRTSTGRMERGK